MAQKKATARSAAQKTRAPRRKTTRATKPKAAQAAEPSKRGASKTAPKSQPESVSKGSKPEAPKPVVQKTETQKPETQKSEAAEETIPLKTRIDRLYTGRSQLANRFRYGLLVFDILTIGYFVATSLIGHQNWMVVIDLVIAVILTVDLALRLWISRRRFRLAMQLMTIADVIVIVSLLLPALTENFAFLRIVRALRLLRSYHVLADLRRRYRFFKRNEEVIQSVVNLFVFIFFITALVYVLQSRVNPQITNYVDALYFTVTTLTTTGFGDITLEGSSGRILSVVIMVFGVGLFLRLVQTIFRPQKVAYKCPNCGLARHEPDAIHCKHCGEMINIETDGD